MIGKICENKTPNPRYQIIEKTTQLSFWRFLQKVGQLWQIFSSKQKTERRIADCQTSAI
jgi:hypothetical protein